MRIDKSVLDDYAILTLKGEFDTFYCTALEQEVDSLLDQGIVYVILNLRLVKFINSTALGAIIKVYKNCRANGGELVVSKPSPFAKEIIGKLGINQLVPLFDEEEQAVKYVIKALNQAEFATEGPLDTEKVLIGLSADLVQRHLGGKKALVGTMCNVDGSKLTFLWSGKKYGLSTAQARDLFASGAELTLKFQVKMFKKGHFDVVAKVTDIQDAQDGNIRVSAAYTRIHKSDQEALATFASDMAYLKRQIPGA